MHIVVLITAKDAQEAQAIADKLMATKTAACVNVVKEVQSTFLWQGKVDQASEALLIVKTKKDLFEELEKVVMDVHSYDSPEIIALPIVAGRKDYLNWIDESVG